MTTYRETYFHRVSFKDGEKVQDYVNTPPKGGKKHGLITSFIVNQKYLGAGSRLPMDMVMDWLELMSYQIEDGIEFHVEEYNGTELVKSEKIKKKPFSELINLFIPDEASVEFGPISLSGKETYEEEITKTVLDKNGKAKDKKEKLKKEVKLEFGFAYDITSLESLYNSFCNFTKTDEGGVHVEAVEDVMSKYLLSESLKRMTDTQKDKYPVTRSDVKSGLRLVVNLSTNAQVQFMGNAKNRIQNEELKPTLREIVRKSLSEYFEKKPNDLNAVCKIIRDNAKARVDMQKAKTATVKGRNSRFDDLELSNFIACNNSKPSGYRELFLVEGKKSAAGSIVNARDSMSQAVFGFRGQTMNPYKCTFAKFMENEEWKNYVKVIRTGIGPTFDINKLWYDKIIIATDADIDGDGIGIGIAATHAMYFPEIITQGHLYRVYPPLYHIDDKNTPFIKNKRELTEIYMKQVSKFYKIRRRGFDYFTKSELSSFMYDIIDYRFYINELYDFCKVPKALLEVICGALVLAGGLDLRGDEALLVDARFTNRNFIRDFMKLVQAKFPEMNLNKYKVSGVASGVSCSVEINQRFVRKMERLIPIYLSYGYDLGVKWKGEEEREMTILEFLDDSYSLTPKILNRFKGLGEANSDQLWDTMLNPANRILVQLTMENIERDMEIFRKLKSDKAIYRRQRKEMVESFKISYEDLDN